jgi:hypothetical protein
VSYVEDVDTPRPIRVPVAAAVSSENVLADIAAAIELVAQRGARRVTLAGLSRPEGVAAEALALAQVAGVEFKLQRDRATGSVSVLIGPLAE